MGLKRPDEFSRRGQRLPGQSSDQDLGLDRRLTIKVVGSAAVLEQELVRIGNVSQGNFIELGPEGIRIFNEGTVVRIWADVDGNVSLTEFRISGVDATDPDAYIGLVATNYDSSAQNSFTLDTSADRATLDAEQFLIGESMRLAGVTTSERNNLPQVDGTIVYNTTTGKFQGYAAGTWVDLH